MGEDLSKMDYEGFMSHIFKLRVISAVTGCTDKSKMEKYFLSFYEELLRDEKPCVAEYGAGVPILGLYLAAQKKIDKLFAIENDDDTLHELEYILNVTKLPVEIIKKDLNGMEEFPDTTVGISINCLYGYATNYAQGVSGLPLEALPRITSPVLQKTKHSRFGLFRYMNNDMIWAEKNDAIADMKNLFENVNIKQDKIKGYARGCRKSPYIEIGPEIPAKWGVYSILGLNRRG